MYGQGNYAPQFGQSPHRLPRPQFLRQQVSHPPAPGGLFHQGHPIAPPAVIQPAAQLAHVVPPGASAYQSASVAQSCPSSSMSSAGQSYVPQPPTGHDRTTLMHTYLTNQQNAHYVSPSPPPPSQSQNLYRHPVHQPSHGPQQIITPLLASALPPPRPVPLQNSTLPSPSTFHPLAPSSRGGSHTSSLTSQVPPLPPSPLPFPPPPPPSSKPMNSDPSVQFLCHPRSNQTLTSGSAENTLMHSQNRVNVPKNLDGSDRGIERKHLELSSLEGGLSSMRTFASDLPPPPPRPANEKTIRNIEILCQFISKNGPAFEDMARQKECGNPDFKFLFGDEPGSEAAIAHEYYLWMKNKSCLENNFPEGQRQSNLLVNKKHVENRSSEEPNNLEAASCSLSDSDMDVEDDITQPDEKLVVNDQVNGLKQDSLSNGDGIEKQDKDNPLQSSPGDISTMKPGPPIKLGGDDGGKSNRTFSSVIETESPVRLLKGYASDDTSDNDARAEVDEPAATSHLQEAVAIASDGRVMRGSSESKETEVGVSGSLTRDAHCKQPNDLDARADASKQNAFHDFGKKDALESSSVGVVTESDKPQREYIKSAASVKVDEFGRLIREGASESDSDDSNYNRRHGRRGRKRSASRSPPDRRRRRRERRSRSWSWSPKRRRSRSKSPFRHAVDVGGKKAKRGQMPVCFNYLKGRCYRGTSCRYLHSDQDKYNRSRHYRRKQHPVETTSSRDYDYCEENKVTTIKGSLEHEVNVEKMQHDEVQDGEVKAYQKQHASSDFASKRAKVDEKLRVLDVSVHHGLLSRDGNAAAVNRNKNATSEESSACKSDSKVVSDLFTSNLQNEDKTEQPVSSWKNEHVDHSHAKSSTEEHHALDNQPQHLNGSSPTSTIPISSVTSTINYPYHLSQLPPPLRLPLPLPLPQPPPPPPPPPPSLHVTSVQHAPPPVQDYISVASEPSVPLRSGPVDNLPSCNALLSNQHSHYPTPQYPSWSTLPPPQLCPSYVVNPPMGSGPAPFEQGSLPLRNDLSMWASLKTNATDLPNHPQVGSLQEQTYTSMKDSHQPPTVVDAMCSDDPLGQAVAGSNSGRDDRYVKSLSSGHFSSSPFPHRDIPPQPASSLVETNSKIVRSFSHKTLPSGEPLRSNFQNPPYLQQHPSYGLYQAAGDRVGGPSKYSADLQREHASHISDIGSSITAHNNPYVFTSDQPLSSKFSSEVFRQGETPYSSKYENSFSLGHAHFEDQKVSYGVSPMIPSPNSSKAGGQTLPKSGGDQYDPLVDSIQPSAESQKKLSGQEDHAADNSDIMSRLSGCKSSDVEANRKKKEIGAVAVATCLENDEFSETAHGEVGVVGSGSQSNPNDGAEGAAGDTEIDQVNREAKSKKSKDSRSMKLFKVELANFVKEMLKPSWRQGNMSKEAFKTIVKKTIEKVSGAIKGHQVPKSKEKINEYIDRSQRKLSILVEGYINKYAKA